MNTWSQTYPLHAGTGVHIHQHAGPVLVAGVAGAEVKVTATCKDDVDVSEYVAVRLDNHGLVVELNPRGWFFGSMPAVRLDLEVPQGTPCQIETGTGSVEVSATGAPVRIQTGSGSVKVNGVSHADIETGSGSIQGRYISGPVSAETGSGGCEFTAVEGALSIEVGSGGVVARQVRGDVRVETGSGQLLVEDVDGRVELETGSGGVTVRRVRGAAVEVDSGGGPLQLKELDVAQVSVEACSGGVEVELLKVYPGANYEITTGSGGVLVAIPPDADLHVRAEAPSGRVHYGGLGLRVNHEHAGELDAVMGQGRAGLHIEAGSGGVRLVPTVPRITEAGAKVVEAVKGDPALESSDQLRRIVDMVEQGKLSPEEAEQLLRALDEEEQA